MWVAQSCGTPAPIRPFKAMVAVLDFYKPKAFAMDKGGNGLPLFQQMQAMVHEAGYRAACATLPGSNGLETDLFALRRFAPDRRTITSLALLLGRANRHGLVAGATGTGKTVVFAHLAANAAERGRVLVLAHRDELVQQAAAAADVAALFG